MKFSYRHNSLDPRRLGRWLWVLMGALLLSSLIELSHDHYAHLKDANDCAICQHAVSFDKVLPGISFVIPQLPQAVVLLLFVSLPHLSRVSFHFQSRAPPFNA